MTNSPTKYYIVPSSEDQHYHSHANAAGVYGDDARSAAEWVPAKAQARWTYFLLGCAILLPWNALINETPFFLSRLIGSPFYPTFSSYLSTIYTLTILICQFYSTITSKQSSPSRRTFASIVAMVTLVISLYLSTFVQATPSAFFSFALFNAISVGAAAGYLCTAVYAGAALLGAPFLQTVISGQAAVAVAVSAVQAISSVISLEGSSPESAQAEAVTPDSSDVHPEEIAARIFFGVSIVFLSITLIAYTWLTRQPFYKSLVGTLERHRRVGDTDELTGLVTDSSRNPLMEGNSRVYQVFKRNLIFMFSIAYVFAVTLAVYPAITVRVRSVDQGTHPLLFTAVHFLVFNIGDLVGRYSCSFPCFLVWSADKILAMALLRTLFIPLILLCNVSRSVTATPVPPIINSDILFMIIMLTTGYTNGFVSTSALLAVSSPDRNPRLNGRREDVDIAATLGSFFVSVGLACGALCSFGVQAMT